MLVVHLGMPAAKSGAGDNTRVGRTAQRRGDLPRLAEPLGVRVAVEVIPNELSRAGSLVSLARTGPRRTAAGICLDFGHAHLIGDVVDAVETVSEHVIATHVHDNRGRDDDHLAPFAGRSTGPWR